MTGKERSKAPNVLWICTDQQRFDTLGCYGNEFVSTPNIDRIARNGVQFNHFYTQSPLCAPSRGSFLTGRYPRTTRLRQNGTGIPECEVPVTRLLAESGYECGLVGKLHLGWDFSRMGGTERRIDDGYGYFHWSLTPFPDWRLKSGQPANEYSHWLRSKGHPSLSTHRSGVRGTLRSASRRRTVKPLGAQRKRSAS